MTEKRECVKCFRPLEQAQTGRPPRYCGEPCRRAAEYEVKRLQRRLETLEEDRRTLRHTRQGYHGNYSGRDKLGRDLKQARKDTDQDIAEMETRLRVLVGGDE